MARHSASEYAPAPVDRPAAYPGRLPNGSFLFHDGEVRLLGTSPLVEVGRRLDRAGRTPLGERIAVLCSGSNANPAQIEKKLQGASDTSLPVLLGRVNDMRPVYSAHVASYGAIPATLDRVPGGEAEIFIGLYTREQLAGTLRSEHGNYRLCEMPGVWFDLGDGVRQGTTLAFLSRSGALVLDGESPLLLSEYSQAQLLATLLAHIGEPSLPSAGEYLDHPDEHQAALRAALAQRPLRREHRFPHRAVEISEIASTLA